MRGTVIEHGGEQWLQADVIKQEDDADFAPTAVPFASFMPFDYGDGEYRLVDDALRDEGGGGGGGGEGGGAATATTAAKP
mgnify:CR=1 FL=1